MPNSESNSNSPDLPRPNYQGLVKFLIEPLLDSPKLLSFDCEQLKSTKKVWIRLAFEEEDRGRIYGRGGRNIHAVRTVLQTAADAAGETLYLEIYDGRNKSEYSSNSSRLNSSKSFPSKEKAPKHGRRRLTRRPLVKPRIA